MTVNWSTESLLPASYYWLMRVYPFNGHGGNLCCHKCHFQAAPSISEPRSNTPLCPETVYMGTISQIFILLWLDGNFVFTQILSKGDRNEITPTNILHMLFDCPCPRCLGLTFFLCVCASFVWNMYCFFVFCFLLFFFCFFFFWGGGCRIPPCTVQHDNLLNKPTESVIRTK